MVHNFFQYTIISHELNYIFKPENYILLIIFSSIGSAILYQIIKENYKINTIMLLTIFIFHGLSKEIYQEYSEPLILFIFLFGSIKTYLHKIYFRKAFVSNATLLLYFSKIFNIFFMFLRFLKIFLRFVKILLNIFNDF